MKDQAEVDQQIGAASRDQKDVAIVGAGFCGTTIAIHQIDYYLEQVNQGHTVPPINIKLIDMTGQFGPGLPYRKENGKCILNQPASEMSPFADPARENHFTEWLNKKYGHIQEYTGDEFVERRVYGQYLKELLKEKIKEVKKTGKEKNQKLKIKVKKIKQRIDDIDFAKGEYTLHAQSGQNIHANSVIFATGHQKSEFLNRFEDNPRYFSGICNTMNVELSVSHDMQQAQKAAQKKGLPADVTMKELKNAQKVVIVGTGPSMMDSLMALKNIGYQGTIYAVSRNQVEPWPYYPNSYKGVKYKNGKNKPPYKLKHFTYHNLKKCPDQSFECFHSIMQDEVANAKKRGYDVGHIMGALKFQQYKAKPRDEAKLANLKSIAYELCVKTYGNPTSPQKYEAYQEFLASGQLKLVKGEVIDKNTTAVQGGFEIGGDSKGFHIRGEGKADTLKAQFLFNGASFTRDPMANPLIRKMIEKKIIVKSRQGDLKSAGRHKNTIGLAGLLNIRERWGTGTFRKNNVQVAQQSMQYLMA